MVARRLTAVVILASFLALAVLSFLGNRALSVVFIFVAGVVLTHHAVRLCPHCSNRACAFNPRFADGSQDGDDVGEVSFSDLKINRTTVVPLLVAGPLAVIAAWLYSPYWLVGVGVVALSAHFVFRELTCKRCGNDCAGNCNAEYRQWKSAQRAQG